MFPIFVASRGRAKDSYLIKELKGSKHSWIYVVEPHEFTDYAALLGRERVMMLPSSDRGLAYVRSWILNYCKQQGIGWYWMLDDDITGFFVVKSKRNVRTPLKDVFARAEKNINDLSARLTLGQIGLEYQQYSWSAGKKYRQNSYCDVCVAINSAVGAKFREETGLKVDRDFTLQVITSGYSTVRICDIAFSAPKNGSNAGGLKEVYDTPGQEAADGRKMIDLWGDTCTPAVKKDGREDVKINWGKFT
jgi:hypothetical protein